MIELYPLMNSEDMVLHSLVARDEDEEEKKYNIILCLNGWL